MPGRSQGFVKGGGVIEVGESSGKYIGRNSMSRGLGVGGQGQGVTPRTGSEKGVSPRGQSLRVQAKDRMSLPYIADTLGTGPKCGSSLSQSSLQVPLPSPPFLPPPPSLPILPAPAPHKGTEELEEKCWKCKSWGRGGPLGHSKAGLTAVSFVKTEAQGSKYPA